MKCALNYTSVSQRRSNRTPQLELVLRLPPRWGGRRPGAGRKSGPRPRIRHRSRTPEVGSRFPCHVSLKLRPGIPSLRTAKLVRELERSFAKCCNRGDFRLVHYSLQHNHLHLVVEADHAAALGRGMKAIGARLARAVHRVFRRAGSVLADRYHVRVLKTPLEVRRAIAYVLLNARRHAAALGRKLEGGGDPASSGAWFGGWEPGSKQGWWAGAERPPPVAAARSWLLRVGWRRHGLIRMSEVPGVKTCAASSRSR